MLSQALSNELGWVLLHAIGCMHMPSSSTLSSTLQVVNTFIVCLFHEIENGNETHIYLAKCNLGMIIKCVGLTQFGNKE